MQGSPNMMKNILDITLVSCKDVHQLLVQDRELFIKNNMSQLQANNQQKNAILQRLTIIMDDLKKACPEGVVETIERIQDINLRAELAKMLDELELTISDCYKVLAINSNTIFTSLNQLKNFWNKLISFKNSQSAVYDQTGFIK